MATRVSGLASGLDIDKFVSDLIKARKTSLAKVEQKATKVEWKKTDLQSIYTAVSDFRAVAFNSTLAANLASRKATSSDENVVVATPNGDAASDAHALRVSQLAESVRVASSGGITATGNEKTTLASQFGLSSNFNLILNDKTIAVNVNASINTLVSQINAAGAGVVAKYDTTLDRFFLASTAPGKYEADGSGARLDLAGNSAAAMSFLTDSLALPITTNKASNAAITPTGNPKLSTTTLANQFGIAGAFNLVLNGKTIAVDPATMTLDQLMTQMSTSTNVTATYDRGLDRVFMDSTNAGVAFDFTGSDAAATDFLTNNLKVMSTDSLMLRGKDALVNYDGAELTIKDNSFSADGATYQLKGVSSSDVVVTIGVDGDKVVENVKSFIEGYNKLIAKINSELKEERYKVPGSTRQYFEPLTDEQRKSMSEEEIKIWEEKARSGLLRNNGNLRSILTNLRNNAISPVSQETVTGPKGSMNQGSNADGGTLSFDKALYYRAGGTPAGALTPLADGADVTSMIQYNGTGSLTSATYRTSNGVSYIEFKTTGTAMNDEFSLKTGGINDVYDSSGLKYTPQASYYKDGVWKYPKANSAYNSASSIGITTGQGDYTYYQEDGTLYLNETTLKEALALDPDVVKRIFGSTGDTTAQKGIAQRLYLEADSAMSKLSREAGKPGMTDTSSALYQQLKDYYTQIDKIQERMEAEEERYYNMFNAMESALQKMNAQSAWLAQQTNQSQSSG